MSEKETLRDSSPDFSTGTKIPVQLWIHDHASAEGNLKHFLQPEHYDRMNDILTRNAVLLLSKNERYVVHCYGFLKESTKTETENCREGIEAGESAEDKVTWREFDVFAQEQKPFIFFTSTVVGLTRGTIDEERNLLNSDEETAIVYFSASGRIVGCIAEKYSDELSAAVRGAISKDEFLAKYSEEFFLIFRDGLLTVGATEDFRHLYLLLSSKEGGRICDREAYDSLTELFIEYKELLK